MNAPQQLLDDMKALAEKHGLDRVEAQLKVTYEYRGHALRDPHSVLYLPGLGWTMKNDLKTVSWGSAEIVGRV